MDERRSGAPLAQLRHWVFDMDGTLTVAVHDFAAIRRALEIPPQDDILAHLAAHVARGEKHHHAAQTHGDDCQQKSHAVQNGIDLSNLPGRGVTLSRAGCQGQRQAGQEQHPQGDDQQDKKGHQRKRQRPVSGYPPCPLHLLGLRGHAGSWR